MVRGISKLGKLALSVLTAMALLMGYALVPCIQIQAELVGAGDAPVLFHHSLASIDDAMEENFTAQIMTDATFASNGVMTAKDKVSDVWMPSTYTNGGGYLTAKTTGVMFNNASVLTYNVPLENFEVQVLYQQDPNRLGLMIHSEKSTYAIKAASGAATTNEYGLASTVENGGVMAYLEQEGQIALRGNVDRTAGTYTGSADDGSGRNAAAADETKKWIRRSVTNDATSKGKLPRFNGTNGSSTGTHVKENVPHRLRLVVRGEDIAVYIDDSATPAITAKLTMSEGEKYISLFFASKYSVRPGFRNLYIRDLDADAQAIDGKYYDYGTPDVSFPSDLTASDAMDLIEANFDAYYKAGENDDSVARETVAGNWAIDNGFLERVDSQRVVGVDPNYYEYSHISILTADRLLRGNFAMEVSYQQSDDRMGVLFGTEKGASAISGRDASTIAKGGAMFFIENEGHTNVKGNVSDVGIDPSFYNESFKRYRRPALSTAYDSANPVGTQYQREWISFNDRTGADTYSPDARAFALQEHTLRLVVIDGIMTAYIDNVEQYTVNLSIKHYEGGYVSLFSSASNGSRGFRDFKLWDLREDGITLGGADENTTKVFVKVNYGSTLPVNCEVDGKYISGWYVDGGEFAISESLIYTSGVEYKAQYVDTKMLDVAYQKTVPADDKLNTRFIASVNQLEYMAVGWVFSLTDTNPELDKDGCVVKESTTVYASLLANGEAKTATDIYDEYSTYLFVFEIKNIPVGTDIHVRSYVKLEDGRIVYGPSKTVTS